MPMMVYELLALGRTLDAPTGTRDEQRVSQFRTLAGGSPLTLRLVCGVTSLGLLLLVTHPRDSQGVPIALAVLGLLLVPAFLSAALAPVGEVRQDAALCTIIGIGWAYAVGFAQYWSTYDYPLVDDLFISAACVVTQAKLCRKKSAGWLIACAALHVPTIVSSSLAGTLARGLAEDPRM